jgi:hypothetical protein
MFFNVVGARPNSQTSGRRSILAVVLKSEEDRRCYDLSNAISIKLIKYYHFVTSGAGY